MWTRRQFLSRTGVAGLSIVAGTRALGKDDEDTLPDGSAAKNIITPAAQEAIDRGLAYLARVQHNDGAFGTVQYYGNVAVTSLAALAMMSGGHQPGRGAYGDNVTRALRYILDQADGGYLKSSTGTSHGPMYGHGFGTLFLAEIYGMVNTQPLRDQLRDTLKAAVKLIVDHQNVEGGWRYFPISQDADVSVTICQIMALRAARNAGFYVPKSTVDQCIRYVKNCQDRDGGFRYQMQGGMSQFARSAAGVVALYCAGVYKGPEVENGLRYLMQFKPGSTGVYRQDVQMHYFYGHYYAAQAMWTAGGHYWADWYPAIRDELIRHSDHNKQFGCWQDHRFSADYATAMACIILQIPNNYLPILQK